MDPDRHRAGPVQVGEHRQVGRRFELYLDGQRRYRRVDRPDTPFQVSRAPIGAAGRTRGQHHLPYPVEPYRRLGHLGELNR